MDEALVKYLNKIINFLENSEDSIYSNETIEELINQIDDAMTKNNKKQIKILFLPTGSLQETAIDNAWASEYCNIAKKVGKLL